MKDSSLKSNNTMVIKKIILWSTIQVFVMILTLCSTYQYFLCYLGSRKRTHV